VAVRRWLLAATRLLALTAVTVLAARDATSTPGAPGQRFAWPDGTRAKVYVSARGERLITGEPGVHWDCSASYSLRVSRRADTLRVDRTEHSGWKGNRPAGLLPDLIVDSVPTILVSSGGEFIDAEGFDAARARIIEDIGERLDPADRVAIDSATTDAGLRAMATDYWNMAFGVWTRFEEPVGRTQRRRHKTPIPQLGGGALDLTLELTAQDRSDCGTAGGAECVEFTMISRPDAEQTAEILGRLLEKAGAGEVVIMAFDVVNEVHSLLERDTMLPHSMTLKRTTTVGMGRKGSQDRGTVTERSERTYRFAYGTESPATERSPD
jgi:hypothetical protein